MKAELKLYPVLGIFLACLLSYAPALQAKQKILFYFKEPLSEEKLSIFLNSTYRSANSSNTEAPLATPPIALSNGAFSLNFKDAAKGLQDLLEVTIPREGHVKIQVLDLYGKYLGTLYDDRLDEGSHIIGPSSHWQAFSSFHGICFSTLSVDGIMVLKKIIVRM